MEENFSSFTTKRYAVVTGANKGIGFEVCRQLAASGGIMVILTARDEKRGIQALEKLQSLGFSDHVVFHQLDVQDTASIASFADFIKTGYGKIDVLVNNAGVGGVVLDGDASIVKEVIEANVASIFGDTKLETVLFKSSGKLINTLEGAEQCLQTNYYGAKRVTEALAPFLQLSDSPTIVNVSSMLGNLKLISNEWGKGVLADAESLTEERVDKVSQKFLEDMKEGSLQANSWPVICPAYKVSKAALNAYTRILAKKYPTFRVNSLCPGFVRTDTTANLGPLSVEEGAKSVVKLALLPKDGPSGLFFYREGISFF